MLVHCPACAATLRLPDNIGGRSARCPKCNGVFYPNQQPTPPGAPLALNESLPSLQAKAPPAFDSDGFGVFDEAATDDVDVVDDEFENPRRAKLLDGDRRSGEESECTSERGNVMLVAAILGGVGAIVIIIGLVFVLRAIFDNRIPDDHIKPNEAAGRVKGREFAFRAIFDDKIPPERWKPFEAAGRFKVQMPGTPQQNSQVVGPITMVQYGYEYDRNTAFIVGHSEGALPRERAALPPDVLLNDACDGALNGITKERPEELKRESINLGQYPGKLMVVNVKNRKVNMVARIYLVGSRIYMLLAVGRGYDEDNENVRKFFDSFELLEKP